MASWASVDLDMAAQQADQGMILKPQPATPLRVTLDIAPTLVDCRNGPIFSIAAAPAARSDPAFAHVHASTGSARRLPGRPERLRKSRGRSGGAPLCAGLDAARSDSVRK